MAWNPDVLELLDYWRENPPEHVSAHCLAVGLGTMKPPCSLAAEAGLAAMDRLLGE